MRNCPSSAGPHSFTDSSTASSEVSQWSSDFDLNDQTISNSDGLENSQKSNKHASSTLAGHQQPDSRELDPSYSTPRSGKSLPTGFISGSTVLYCSTKTDVDFSSCVIDLN